MEKSKLNRVLFITLLFSIANFSSICALKNTKLDSIQSGGRPTASSLDFSQFLEVSISSIKSYFCKTQLTLK